MVTQSLNSEDRMDTQDKPGCCPSADKDPALSAAPLEVPAGAGPRPETAQIPGGTALVGTDRPQIAVDGEGPLRRAKLAPFEIGVTAVTNAEFAAFIDATGYVTEAERFGWSFVFWDQVPESVGATQAVVEVQWWRRVDGAIWSAPNGPGTEAACLPDHPVVHVSWNDARAYARWVGGRLPSEAEWEHAARGGQADVRFPWGDLEPDDIDTTPCNIWQGAFPDHNTQRDGYAATAPARSFEPNAYGLYNMAGNVWEWTADAYKVRSLKREVKERLKGMRGYRLSKGGSFLCHRSYCYRYRIAARSGNSPDSTTTHQGFRVVWPAGAKGLRAVS
ncbi:Sulfatase modifying factor 1 precursor (C-alpha-formyglycine- generating enzyme 1) [Candidatus Rhodobacter oscarellae]|uniref:Sulfatase modifying factor 1 (C-alpha-formyglycine-generating enzyme 1) n=1 Tax=Candidatus Rhodobacter oscarellae TaxID=1675527 RepID=A0A0J9EDW4_9RHOB|nr:formylglycine-generating enzyme family protein [Candidatus Rhodobacter lobularis]KMW60816.1 Sulfatase modifying factor 1 precursor (C-alpha-formyglycine- generating enzyme 1) [Candidatus Rhodobacter lobularis]